MVLLYHPLGCIALTVISHADPKGDNFFKIFERKMEEKRERLKESGGNLGFLFFQFLL